MDDGLLGLCGDVKWYRVPCCAYTVLCSEQPSSPSSFNGAASPTSDFLSDLTTAAGTVVTRTPYPALPAFFAQKRACIPAPALTARVRTPPQSTSQDPSSALTFFLHLFRRSASSPAKPASCTLNQEIASPSQPLHPPSLLSRNPGSRSILPSNLVHHA